MPRKNILVIAPHADDETIGCGGVIHKFKENGYSVHVLIVTDSYIQRMDEYKNAQTILGFDDLFFIKLKDQLLSEKDISSIADNIHNYLSLYNYEMMFFPFIGDLNSDHTIVSKASMVALRTHFNTTGYMYPVYETTDLATIRKFSPNIFIKLNEENIKAKQAAILKYISQYKANRIDVKSYATIVGYKINSQYAEEFELWRSVL